MIPFLKSQMFGLLLITSYRTKSHGHSLKDILKQNPYCPKFHVDLGGGGVARAKDPELSLHNDLSILRDIDPYFRHGDMATS